MAESDNEKRQKILAFLHAEFKKDPSNFIADEDIAEKCNLDKTEVKGICIMMEEEGLIRLVEAAGEYRFYIIKSRGIQQITGSIAKTPRPSHSTFFGPSPTSKEIDDAIKEAKANAIPRMIINSNSVKSRLESNKEWASKNKRKIGVGSITAVAIVILAVLALEPIHSMVFPPQSNVLVGDLNADGGTINGDNPNYVYQPRTMTPNGTQSENFYLTLQNDGEGIAKNFKIDILWQPSTDWINFEHTNVVNSGFSSNCPEKSNVCKFESLTKQTGLIKLQYSIQINWKKYQEIKNKEPQVIFYYDYDGMSTTKQIAVNVIP